MCRRKISGAPNSGSASTRPIRCSKTPSIPAPDPVGVSVLHLRGDIVRLAITNRTQHSDPVQEFAADVAGLQQLVLSGFGDKPIDLLLLEIVDDAHRPVRVRHAV